MRGRGTGIILLEMLLLRVAAPFAIFAALLYWPPNDDLLMPSYNER